MKFLLRAALVAMAMCAVMFLYTRAMRHWPGEVPSMAPANRQADAILVDKSRRRMQLLRNGKVLRSYRISLGASPVGHKQREGDERTPEGDYIVDWRNPRSMAYLSLHISYPSLADVARANVLGANPGGDIMIHGLPNGWGGLGKVHRLADWTNGCIAVSNDEMREIWSLVPDGTAIRING